MPDSQLHLTNASICWTWHLLFHGSERRPNFERFRIVSLTSCGCSMAWFGPCMRRRAMRSHRQPHAVAANSSYNPPHEIHRRRCSSANQRPQALPWTHHKRAMTWVLRPLQKRHRPGQSRKLMVGAALADSDGGERLIFLFLCRTIYVALCFLLTLCTAEEAVAWKCWNASWRIITSTHSSFRTLIYLGLALTVLSFVKLCPVASPRGLRREGTAGNPRECGQCPF
jgi:hypothetical protein